jgi:hypothetical protein
MVFNATFNNISVISWQKVLSVEEIGVSEENHRSAVSVILCITFHLLLKKFIDKILINICRKTAMFSMNVG